MRKLTRKGYGRIYCKNQEDIQKIKDIIKEIDEFEYEYLPENFIGLSSEYPNSVYTGKFSDMDMDKLQSICWERGIFMWIYDSGVVGIEY